VTVSAVMTEHPSWRHGDGGAYRAVRAGSSVWALVCRPTRDGQETVTRRVMGVGDSPVVDVFDPARLTGPEAVVGPLRTAGTVARWRNPDMWDAMATAIVRQVIRAGQARKLYRAFSKAHGDRVSTEHGDTWLFPTPETVLAVSDAEFTRLGLAFKARPLRAAAEAYLDFGQKWAELAPADLVHEVQHVPRIGPWSAGATVADLSNDYALYPYADLAVRTWAKRLAPQRAWPESEAPFAHVWARLAGDQLSDWTLLTLAWGANHAHSAGGAAS
jgi:DNA-3-methyladenine glycosylase II